MKKSAIKKAKQLRKILLIVCLVYMTSFEDVGTNIIDSLVKLLNTISDNIVESLSTPLWD